MSLPSADNILEEGKVPLVILLAGKSPIWDSAMAPDILLATNELI